ncbi:MAG: hypothetical protein Q9M35_02560 [Rhodothermus sp.]|nr:hypothetical protein [Rhodothermus sp.]
MQTAASQDRVLEEALREIREAMRRSASEDERRSPASFDETFHNLEQTSPSEAWASSTPASLRLESAPKQIVLRPEGTPAPATETTLEQARRTEAVRLFDSLQLRKRAREAVVLAELLGPPRARRPWRPPLA